MTASVRAAGLLAGLAVLGVAARAAAPEKAAPDARHPAPGIVMREISIPMPDGVRLAADLWMPETSAAAKPKQRLPVLLEYLPYRKTEARGDRFGLYAYFVRRGYVVARVDIRGTGNSEGVLIPYEYSDIENQDGDSVIAWLAKQPYSSGKVGMFGISWGGFNSLHMAMRNPPALGAIIAVDATDDLYEDDVHFMDGGIHVDSWEMSMDLANAMPGAPGYVIDDRLFADRFDRTPWMFTYKKQQRDGPFWDRTTLKRRYESIRIPTFVIGGWYDGYRDSVPRMLEHVKAPMKAMVGPWSHCWPHDAYPKPGMEWRHEAVRWFDRWLKGTKTGIDQEPRLAVFVRRWHPPGPRLEGNAPGEWRYEDGWPLARGRERILYPHADHTLADAPAAAARHELRYVPTSGVEIGGPVMWWGDVAPDQRPSDAYSLVYDSAPVTEEVEILGLPHAMLDVTASAPLARWFTRLSDVAPDGTVTLVAGAGFNGAHRESSRDPKAIEPGKPFTIDIEMHFTSWVFQPGHRLRLAVSNAMWPMIWPTPSTMTTTLALAGTRLVLPVVPKAERPRPQFLPPAKDETLAGFGTLETGTASGYGEIETVERHPPTGDARIVATNVGGSRFPWGTQHETESIVYEAGDRHPDTGWVTGDYSTTVTLPDRTLRFEARAVFRSDAGTFYLSYTRRLFQDGVLVREKTWDEPIPRDFQ
ncbi:MAG TPA: CocE/NonD family hydrolase [Verrucomicrobiae bacterium]|nr:CocE/NonD family hydrolase [Verrucomicrobiae bacterium]